MEAGAAATAPPQGLQPHLDAGAQEVVDPTFAPPDSPSRPPQDWNAGQSASGIVVRNTFIDVCPLEEESDGGEEGSCASPHRRNLSAPPSPSRTRNPWQTREAGASDEEMEEDPSAIPNYQWGPDGGLVSAEGAEWAPNVHGMMMPPWEAAHGSGAGMPTWPPEDSDQVAVPPWLRMPPGSPKKVPARPKKGNKAPQDGKASAGPRPALGEFLKNGGGGLGNIHGGTGAEQSDRGYGQGFGGGVDLGLGLGRGIGPGLGGGFGPPGAGSGLDPRGLSTAPPGQQPSIGTSFGGYGGACLGGYQPDSRLVAAAGHDPQGLGLGLDPSRGLGLDGMDPPRSFGGAQGLAGGFGQDIWSGLGRGQDDQWGRRPVEQFQERLGTAPPGAEAWGSRRNSREQSEIADMNPGAAYISDNPPPRDPLGGHIPTEAPAYILGAACSTSGASPPVLSSQPMPPPSSSASHPGGKGGDHRGRPGAADYSAPGRGRPKGGGADLGGVFGGDPYGGAMAEGMPAFQIANGMGHGGMDHYADYGGGMDRYGDSAFGNPWSGGRGIAGGAGAVGQVVASDRGHLYAGGGGADPMAVGSNAGGKHGGQWAAHQGGGKSGNAHQGGGQQQQRGRQQERPEHQQAAPANQGPWIAPGAMQGIADHEAASGGKGKGGKGAIGKGGDDKGEAKGRVPLSGGGPKRTDYIKKYGADGEGPASGPPANVPITTMMLKNIPCRKAQEEVMSHIDTKGFGNRYDFFYLPRDVKFRANLGYAFINFVTPEDASNFSASLNGYRFSGSGSTKACAVVPAHVQGLMNNLAAFKRTEVMRSSRKPYFSGVVTL